LTIDPNELDAALKRDQESAAMPGREVPENCHLGDF
jgi:hypothetical protein